MTDREKMIELIFTKELPIMRGEDQVGIYCTPYHCAEDISDHLIANGVTVQKWIPVTERLPEPETEVLILARSGKRHIITTGMYEDGSKNTEDSEWWWETDGFEYDEELDAYIIPEGWWEYKHYNGDDEYNHAIDNVVTHWMPLPEPPKGE